VRKTRAPASPHTERKRRRAKKPGTSVPGRSPTADEIFDWQSKVDEVVRFIVEESDGVVLRP
jgi:hypothetical protein